MQILLDLVCLSVLQSTMGLSHNLLSSNMTRSKSALSAISSGQSTPYSFYQHHRKSSLYSDFRPNPDLMSSLTFTENFKFSYFEIPKHVTEHNKKIQRGRLWLPLQTLAKKEVIFKKERKVSPHPSRLIFDPADISVSGISITSLENNVSDSQSPIAETSG